MDKNFVNMKYCLCAIIFIIILQSCCKYAPIADHTVLLDFEKGDYIFAGRPFLNNSDSLKIGISANTNIPSKCRSRKLNFFYSNIRLDIIQNRFLDTLKVNLTQSSLVICTDGKDTLNGRISLLNSRSDCYLMIIKDKYFLRQDGITNDSIVCKFDYSLHSEFNYKNQELMVNLGNLITPGNEIIKTNKVVGIYHKNSNFL